MTRCAPTPAAGPRGRQPPDPPRGVAPRPPTAAAGRAPAVSAFPGLGAQRLAAECVVEGGLLGPRLAPLRLRVARWFCGRRRVAKAGTCAAPSSLSGHGEAGWGLFTFSFNCRTVGGCGGDGALPVAPTLRRALLLPEPRDMVTGRCRRSPRRAARSQGAARVESGRGRVSSRSWSGSDSLAGGSLRSGPALAPPASRG